MGFSVNAQQNCSEDELGVAFLDKKLCFPKNYQLDFSKIDKKFITIKSFGFLNSDVGPISKSYNSIRVGSIEQLREEKELSKVGESKICGEYNVTYFNGNPMQVSNENYEVIIISSENFFMEYIVNDRSILYDSMRLYEQERGCVEEFLKRISRISRGQSLTL